MSNKELKALLKQRNAATYGNRELLIARIESGQYGKKKKSAPKSTLTSTQANKDTEKKNLVSLSTKLSAQQLQHSSHLSYIRSYLNDEGKKMYEYLSNKQPVAPVAPVAPVTPVVKKRKSDEVEDDSEDDSSDDEEQDDGDEEGGGEEESADEEDAGEEDAGEENAGEKEVVAQDTAEHATKKLKSDAFAKEQKKDTVKKKPLKEEDESDFDSDLDDSDSEEDEVMAKTEEILVKRFLKKLPRKLIQKNLKHFGVSKDVYKMESRMDLAKMLAHECTNETDDESGE